MWSAQAGDTAGALDLLSGALATCGHDAVSMQIWTACGGIASAVQTASPWPCAVDGPVLTEFDKEHRLYNHVLLTAVAG